MLLYFLVIIVGVEENHCLSLVRWQDNNYYNNINVHQHPDHNTNVQTGCSDVVKAYPWPRRDITNLVGSEHLLTTVVMVMTMTVTADELREGRHGQKLKKDKKKEKEQKKKEI